MRGLVFPTFNGNSVFLMDFENFKDIGKFIGGNVEIVRPVKLPDPYLMLVDECGLMKDDSVINPLASVLYGINVHGGFIVGSAVVVKEGIVNGEPDILGLSDFDIEVLNSVIIDSCNKILSQSL